ncbi:MAG: STAS domain-containing protein [Verrucomicrobiota bacterium]|nr:STAS domain-containing protein [Verrucomicrobiota bacterium]
MDATLREDSGVQVIEAKGELDLAHAPKIRILFDQIVSKKASPVLVNFSGITYIDSSGVATIIDAMQRTKKYKGTLALCGVNQVVKSVLEIAKVYSLFTIFPDEATGLEKLKS